MVVDANVSDAPLLRGLGATHIVPRGPGISDAVRQIFPSGVDGLVDAALISDIASGAVRHGGAAVTLRRTSPITDKRLRAFTVHVFDQDTNASALAWLAALVSEGKLTPRISLRSPLTAAAEAHRIVARGGLRGQVVLMMNN